MIYEPVAKDTDLPLLLIWLALWCARFAEFCANSWAWFSHNIRMEAFTPTHTNGGDGVNCERIRNHWPMTQYIRHCVLKFGTVNVLQPTRELTKHPWRVCDFCYHQNIFGLIENLIHQAWRPQQTSWDVHFAWVNSKIPELFHACIHSAWNA